MNEKRGSWYLLTGLVLGLIAGFVISLTVIPVKYMNTDPSTLSEADQQAYRIMVAQAYLAEGDAGRAITRLSLLQEKNPSEAVIAQAQSMLAEGGSEVSARALAMLAAAVSEPSLAITPLPMLTPLVEVAIAQPTSGTPSANTTQAAAGTPQATNTPRPTATPQPTLGSPFIKHGEPEPICDPLPAFSLLQVIVVDSSGQAVPGVRIEISQTNGGTETFFSGLYPSISLGYADYLMQPEAVYTLRVGESGQQVPNLAAPACGKDAEGKQTYGSLRVIFQQP